ncbi:hypothetical protein V9T40_011335 [Parthenolecanium corni]|uniref:Protein LTV1 homolog n=1 Tax=Parthenolecanium corni TaxID=536013 RepID=A0AAN9T6P2_9HEMI
MPKKKKFIDKKKAVTFQVVHRSQRDPLITDETAPQRVLVPTVTDKSSNNKEKIKEELVKYGIYFDDDYNYLQHLRDVNKTNVEWVEVPKNSKPEKQKLNLPSSVFASDVEEKVGLLNKAAPQSGLRLDLDPDIVAAMDEDFDFSDPENMLEDNFMELANQSPSGSQCDEDEGDDDILSDSGSGFTDEMGDEIGSLNEFEKKSVFTDYSMSSSVISRNSQLTLLDETFEQVFGGYDDTEIGALECEDIEGELDTDCPMFQKAAEEFERERKLEKLTIDDITKLNINQGDESDNENDYLMEVKEKEKWDCESILSTYSNLYNHPKLIKEPVQRIKVDKRTGIPIETQKLTKHALSQLNTLNSGENPHNEFDSQSKIRVLNEKRIGNESLEEKRSRKRLTKELKRERRMERKANSAAFKEEKKRIEKTMAHNKLNLQGITL